MSAKTHNRASAFAAKVEMRRNVLAEVRPARVFDAFCGPVGELYRQAWAEADSYVGCDLEWRPEDARRRFVGDNRVVMRAVDLDAFNVFDFDAFGSPWEQAIILAARRRWKPGERGAVLFTDGGSRNSRFGTIDSALAQLIGCSRTGLACKAGPEETYHRMAVRRWAERSRVRVRRQWHATSQSSGVGAVWMAYTALVFEGLP